MLRGGWLKVLLAVGVLKVLLLVGVLCSACHEELVSNKYCNFRAHFSYTPVIAVSQLYAACNSPGEWATIRAQNEQIIFQNLDGSTPVNKVTVDGYKGYNFGLSGYIVGLPNIPELGTDVPVVTCYDLACSNCYRDSNLGSAKRLTLQAAGHAYCSFCKRTYDLNNTGQVSKGEAGISLYRYRVYYNGNTLAISNK